MAPQLRPHVSVPTVSDIEVPETLLKKRKQNEKAREERLVAATAARKAAKAKRKVVFKRAEAHVKEYLAKEKDEIRLKRAARATEVIDRLLHFCSINEIAPKPRKILQLLRLLQINNGVFVKVTKATEQMLRLVEPYVTYGEPNLKSVRELIYKRGYGKVDKQRIPLANNGVIEESLGKFDILSVEDLVHEIFTTGPNFKQASNFLWPFKLSNPTGGWRTRKFKHYVQGAGQPGGRLAVVDSDYTAVCSPSLKTAWSDSGLRKSVPSHRDIIMPLRKHGEKISGTREVTTLLHTLRGEEFRHSQNLKRSKAHISSVPSLHSHNKPSLPPGIFHQAERSADAEPHGFPNGPVPGPRPPQSWSKLFGKGKGREEWSDATWRAEALSLMFSHMPESAGSYDVPSLVDDSHASSVTPLTLLCLRVLLSALPGPEFAEEVVPELPTHLRRDLMRWTAVHAPLQTSRLLALCEPDGNADGELLVVGPQASLPPDYFADATSASSEGLGSTAEDEGSANEEEEESSWDAPSSSSSDNSIPLHSLILLDTVLSPTVLFTFPPTLTHLALLALPTPVPVYRLPGVSPLLEVLDLSYNPWLDQSGSQSAAAETVIQRVEWRRWGALKVLGLRGCAVRSEIIDKVNKGRWSDIEIVGVEPQTIIGSRGVAKDVINRSPD
ncbi:60S ribosomal protein L7-B [Grifola frondosa]|uniref:60S ribosomal protein L7-B n=1 Tax=Grifola frondosa TaxID=5627 RepID=A0A1C7MFV6_GRIFR|nr:60S ribosomal protein L7-B [Grifola frondosa]